LRSHSSALKKYAPAKGRIYPNWRIIFLNFLFPNQVPSFEFLLTVLKEALWKKLENHLTTAPAKEVNEEQLKSKLNNRQIINF